MKIFLSYSSKDRAAVEPIHQALAAQGHDVFFDREDLAPGTQYDDAIRTAIEASDLFVFIASAASLTAGSYTLTELDLAQKHWANPSGHVLPVLLGTASQPVPLDHLPPYLKAVTVLDPVGNVAAEVVDAVHRLGTVRRAPLRRLLVGAALALVVIAAGAWFYFEHRPGAGTDGAPMASIPAGSFTMGDDENSPRRQVYVSAFDLDRFEVTTARFARFLQATGGVDPPDGWDEAQASAGDLPVVGVDWRQADAYCRWAGKRLPTEAEWERAARGTQSALYPWGDDAPTAARARFLIRADSPYRGGLAPVGSHAAGASREGVQDLEGNASEWVADWYAEGFAVGDVRDPKGPASGTGRVIRGGGWQEPPERLLAARRGYASPENRADDLGFRCARDAAAR